MWSCLDLNNGHQSHIKVDAGENSASAQDIINLNSYSRERQAKYLPQTLRHQYRVWTGACMTVEVPWIL